MKKLLFLSVILLAAVSCGRKEKQALVPSPEFATYVSAYTGGVISTAGTIRVELVRAQADIEPNTPVTDKLFSFSPSVKGETRWVSANVIEFTPAEGALKSGTYYEAEFRLGKVESVEKGLETLKFSFRTKSQDFELSLDPGIISANNPMVMRQGGTIAFGDVVDAAAVERMLKLGNKKGPAIEPSTGKATSFTFSFDALERPSDEDKTLELVVKGKEAGIDRTEEFAVLVPAEGKFRFVNAGALGGNEEGAYLQFSEPLDTQQDMGGLVTIEGVSEYTTHIEDNIVKIFFQSSREGGIELRADAGIRSSDGKRLGTGVRTTLWTEAQKPEIELSSSGVIMPDAKNLTLRFRAVSLSAVDVKIVRIYENNVLMFLQTNTLTGSDELRRSGREIYNKPLYLTGATTSGQWQDYEVDLSSIVRQEPGAIYRIELGMRREYSTYQCGGKVTGGATEPTEGMVQLMAGQTEDYEESSWDTPQPWSYYWDEYDYDNYSWRDRDDPCKPSYYMGSDRRATCNVMASNLGVIVKSGASRKVWVAVTDILTTKPVGDATVKVYNYQLQLIGEGRTDAQGMAEAEIKGVGFAAVVEKEGQRTYVKMTDADQNSLSRFDVGGKQIQKGLKGYIYGERGVWRPGDTLHLTMVLEDRMKKIPDNHPVTLEIFNPRGQFHTRQVNAHGMNGFYSFDVPTSEDDPTGVWNAYVKVGGASFHKSLRIETIKPNRLKINFKVPGDKIDGSGRSTPASLAVSWLTGATARNLKAAVEMTVVKGGSSPFKGYERFTFNNPAVSFSSEKIDVWDGKVDGEGKASLNISSPSVDEAPGMMRADVVCRVFEPGGDASIYVESFPFSPFPRYVGVDVTQKPGEYFETNRANSFDVVTVDAKGSAVDAHLDWKVYKLRWSWWWDRGDESLESYVNGNYASPVAEGSVGTVMGRGKISFQVDYPDWGRYLIYVKDRSGGHASGGIVYVDWPSSYGRAQRSDPDGATMLTFTTDKTSYDVGETATVVIPGTGGGRALVSFENGSSVLGGHWVEMSSGGDTKYSFKVTPEMAPNFYIHISLLQPHGQRENSSPIRMYGVMPVEVNNKASVLEPVISAPDVLRPQTEFTVKVSEKTGTEMTYTLAVVDEGLLDLTNFKTPNPWKEFYAREALGVRTWDVYDFVMGAYGTRLGALLSIGGDESLKPAERKANRFKPVVKFLGPFTVKKGSSNSHKITLPMYVGSVRVMVVAGGNAAYGCAEKAIPVRTPLMVLTTLPRVMSIGEEIMMPVNVFAMEDDVKNVTVKAEVTGGVALSKDKQLTVNFAKPSDQMVYFRLKAGDLPDVANIKITASCGKHSASESVEIAVRNPNPILTTVIDTLLPAGARLALPYELGSLPNAENWVKLEVSNLPQVDLSRRYDYLDNYQHLCSEQLTSRGMPMLYLGQFRDVDKKEAEKITKGVDAIIKLLYGRQLNNGGIAYWPGYTDANEWITSYAGNFLIEAQQHGYEVNAGVIKRWKEYQRRAALSWALPKERDQQYYWYYQPDLVQAYRLYTLALAGSPETGAMNRMKEMPNISVAAKWRLAGAYAVAGKQKAAEEIVAGIKTTVETYPYGSGYTYGSPQRDDAMILETMVKMGDMTAAMRQAKVISASLRGETYLSTQSTAFSLVAMGSFAAKMNSGALEYGWAVDGKEQKNVSTSRAVSQMDVPAIQRKGEVTLTSRSKGDLFVSLVSRTRPLVDTYPAMNSNITIAVKYTDMGGNPVRPDSLGQGTDLRAVVTVTNVSGVFSYTDMALTHIVPSGWEIFNERMAVSDEAMAGNEENASQSRPSRYSRAVPDFSYRDIRDDRVLTYFDLRRGESKSFTVRLQAAYVGRFILPAIECEAMYDPTVRARTAAGTAVVK